MTSKFKRFQYWKLTVIGIGVFILGVLLFLQLLYAKKTYIYVKIKGSPGNWWWVTPRPPDWLAYSIHKGDKEYNSITVPIAEITSIDIYDAGGPTRDVYAVAKIEVRQNKQTKKYTYKGEPVEIGGPISMSLDSAFFPGMVVAIYGDQPPTRTYVDKTIVIRMYGKWPYQFNAIVPGETIKDGDGIVIAEIVKAERVPSEVQAETSSGGLVKAFSPIYQDFFVTVHLKVQERNGEYVFREEQYLKVGNNVWLMFPSMNMSGAEILSIQ